MSSCIQTVASVAMVLLTGATLCVLWGYARDTKRIAKDSATQVERAQMPFLAIGIWERDENHPQGGWILENQGFGPAINIIFRDRNGQGEAHIRPIGVGGQYNSHNSIANTLQQAQGFEVRYESLSGKMYQTLIVRRDDGTLETTFGRL